MPEIRQYNEQVSPAGPVGFQQATADDFGGGIDKAIGNFGSQVTNTGEVIYKKEVQSDLSDLDVKVAAAKNKLGLEYQDQLQKGTLNHDDFMDKVQDEMDDIGQGVNTGVGQQRFQKMQAQTNLDFSQRAQEGQAKLAGVKAVQNFTVASANRSSAVMNDPSMFQQSLKDSDQSVDDLVANHGLPAEHADLLKRQGMDDLAKGAVRGIMKHDPDEAMKQITSGVWDPYMNENTKYRLENEIDTSKRAKLIDEERQKKLAGEKAAEVQDQTAQGYLAKMYGGGTLPAQQVISDMQAGKIDSTTGEHFLRALDQHAQERKLKSDPEVFNALTQRLALPDGDPNKITSIDDINKHLGKDISIPDANLLYGVLREKGTDQGEADAAMKKTYFDNTKNTLVKKNALGMDDPDGAKIYQDIQAKSWQYALTAAKNGKSANQIWSPTLGGKYNPDYVGNNVAAPTRTAQDIMDSTMNLMNKSLNKQPPGTTEMVDENGKTAYVKNEDVPLATKKGAKVKASK